MGSRYNPSNRKDNCGFCAIAYGLHLQKHIETDADRLYLKTLERLGLKREGGRDPIPRMLIFPGPMLESAAVRTEYHALTGGLHGLSSYTITSVARDSTLGFREKIKDLDLVRQFMAFYTSRYSNTWNIRDFEQKRLEFLQARGLNPRLEAMRKYIADELGGHSILGSKEGKHYINVFVDMGQKGTIEAYDAQDGVKYDAHGLNARLGSVDLVMHLD